MKTVSLLLCLSVLGLVGRIKLLSPFCAYLLCAYLAVCPHRILQCRLNELLDTSLTLQIVILGLGERVDRVEKRTA